MYYPEPESATLEWKEALPQNDQIVKTLIGFCNQHGGRIVVGVKNDGTVLRTCLRSQVSSIFGVILADF